MSASIQPDIENIDNIAASEAVSRHLLSLQQQTDGWMPGLKLQARVVCEILSDI